MQVLTSVVAAPQPRSPDVTVRQVTVSESQTQRSQRSFVLKVILIIATVVAAWYAGKYLLPKVIEWYEQMPPIGKMTGGDGNPTKPGLFPKLVDLTEDSPLIAVSPKPVIQPSFTSMAEYAATQTARKTMSAVAGRTVSMSVLEATPMPSSYSLPAVSSALSAATAATTASTLAISIGTVLLQTILMVL